MDTKKSEVRLPRIQFGYTRFKRYIVEEPQDPCRKCGATAREQAKGCNQIDCYRQFIKR